MASLMLGAEICHCLAPLKVRLLAEPASCSAHCQNVSFAWWLPYVWAPLSVPILQQTRPPQGPLSYWFYFFLLIFPLQSCRHSIAWHWFLTASQTVHKMLHLQGQPVHGRKLSPCAAELLNCVSPGPKGKAQGEKADVRGERQHLLSGWVYQRGLPGFSLQELGIFRIWESLHQEKYPAAPATL